MASQTNKDSKTTTPAQNGRNTPSTERVSILDIVARFRRFFADALGVLLIAGAIMGFLAIFNLTRGVILTPLAGNLKLAFGWGSVLLLAALAYGGYLLINPRRRDLKEINWQRFVVLEISVFSLLILLTFVGGHSIDRAEAGLDGGLIGWGLSEFLTQILGPIWWIIPVGVVFVWSIASGLGISTRLRAWSGMKLESLSAGLKTDDVLDGAVAMSPGKSVDGLAPEKPKGRRKDSRLPPEFRKKFRVVPPESSKSEPPPRDERLPPLDLLAVEKDSRPDERTINQTAGMIEKTLAEFGLPAKVVGFQVGPTVTQFAVEPGYLERPGPEDEVSRQKVRVSQISALARDLALALSADRLRVQAPVPGRPYVGIEVPNHNSSRVRLRSILESEAFYKTNSPLSVALGRNVSGEPVVADLASMPHLLIAGATGSGKSICISAITACLVMNNTPQDLRLVLVDPKMVEMVRFNGLPHLIGKVETDLTRMLMVLHWTVLEMDRRYKLLEEAGVRDIDAYNNKIRRRKTGEVLPRIVALIDELADLMMIAGDQTEQSLVRLAQMARATGIHLVLATQRPSTDVVTGLIKANFPARISFAVASSVDSRVILDTPGAESLLGKGDMLFLPPEAGSPFRVQGVMISDQEIERMIDFWRGEGDYQEEEAPWEGISLEESRDEDDGLVEEAISIVQQSGRASTSMLQRRLRVGYPRAARLIDQLEELGVVGPSLGPGKERDVLIESDGLDEYD
jgi:DNA segregation ATPase FtsK/SpoIIIE, S-DNA-T family